MFMLRGADVFNMYRENKNVKYFVVVSIVVVTILSIKRVAQE